MRDVNKQDTKKVNIPVIPPAQKAYVDIQHAPCQHTFPVPSENVYNSMADGNLVHNRFVYPP